MASQHSRIIGTVLSPALQLWLRSLLEGIEELRVQIGGGDRQILSGYIPQVSLQARQAIYQGLHLSQIQVVGENIRVNLGQVMRGKPLRLLEPILVEVELFLSADDLKASLRSPLLANALSELLEQMLRSANISNLANFSGSRQINWEKVAIDTNKLILGGNMAAAEGSAPIVIETGLLAVGRYLQLTPLQIYLASELVNDNLDSYQIDLGAEVDFEQLALLPEQLACKGRIKVLP